MTNQHKATPDEWAQQEGWANRLAFSYSSCIIELRGRIEALEAAQQPPQDKLDRLIAIDREDSTEAAAQQPLAFTGKVVAPITRDRDETGDYIIVHDTPALNSSLVDRIATDAELCQVYNDAPDHCGKALRAVYDLGRQHGAAPIRSGPESPLVERVADAIAAQATSAGIVNDRPARAAILEVVAALLDWWDSDEVARTGWEAAKWLEQEINR
jgi:hypothetical protein